MATIIEKKSDITKLASQLKKGLKSRSRGVDTKKYCGIIKLDEDPVIIQRKLRNEWE